MQKGTVGSTVENTPFGASRILNFLLGLKTLKHEGVTNREELEETLYAALAE